MNQYSILYIKSIFKFKFYPTPEKDIFNTISLKRVFQVIHINLQSIPYCTFIVHIGVTETFMLILPMVPPILDIIVPLNVSRKRIFLYPAYFWLDDEKYYVLLLGHMIITLLMICFIFCACDTNYVYAVQHACGLLAIAKYENSLIRESIIISIDETNHCYE